jgi:hypothetical protein
LLLFGDGGDQGVTGGGSLTIDNLFGNHDQDLTIGTEVFTGRSVNQYAPRGQRTLGVAAPPIPNAPLSVVPRNWCFGSRIVAFGSTPLLCMPLSLSGIWEAMAGARETAASTAAPVNERRKVLNMFLILSYGRLRACKPPHSARPERLHP